MHAWDTCIQAMSAQPDVLMLRALLGNQLCKCSAFKLMFMTIDGSSAGSHKKEYKYLHNLVNREIERGRSDGIRLQLTNGSPDVMTAAATAGTSKSAKREERKVARAKAKANKGNDGQPPADAATATLASADKPQICRSFANIGKCDYGDECKFSHSTAHKPKAAAKPKADAKAKAGGGRSKSPKSQRSHRSRKNNDNLTKEENKQIDCVWFPNPAGCNRVDKCSYRHRI